MFQEGVAGGEELVDDDRTRQDHDLKNGMMPEKDAGQGATAYIPKRLEG